jgi:hypothetical protein
MKRLLSASVLLSLPHIFMFQVSTTSCTKETLKYDTVTVIKKDTIIIKDTVLSTELLVANSWKMQEMRGVLGGTKRYYLRGGSANTENLDNEYIAFNQNGTGTYVENNSIQHSITWSFSNDAHTKLALILSNTPTTFTITWDNIRYKNKSLYFDSYYTDGNLNANEHSQNIRIPR